MVLCMVAVRHALGRTVRTAARCTAGSAAPRTAARIYTAAHWACSSFNSCPSVGIIGRCWFCRTGLTVTSSRALGAFESRLRTISIVINRRDLGCTIAFKPVCHCLEFLAQLHYKPCATRLQIPLPARRGGPHLRVLPFATWLACVAVGARGSMGKLIFTIPLIAFRPHFREGALAWQGHASLISPIRRRLPPHNWM